MLAPLEIINEPASAPVSSSPTPAHVRGVPITPLVPYHGGKGRIASWLVSLMPEHRVYVEPFAGSAAVLLAKTPSVHEVLNDIDGNAVAFYRVLRDQPAELERVCRLSPYSREEFARADLDEAGMSDLERARRWWVRTNQSFSHTASIRTGWATSIKRGSNNARSVLNRIDRFEVAAQRLGHVTLESMDALEMIERYSVPDGVIYADPPYLSSTRTTMTKRPSGDYVHEFASEDDHRRLAAVLRASCSTVLLSGYASELYEELYGGWFRTERKVLRRTSNGRSGGQAHTVEVVWSNRPLEAQAVLDFTTPKSAPGGLQ